MTISHWLLGLLYLLIGQIFSLVYVLSFKRTEQRTSAPWLGLMGLCWPLYILLDLVLTLAGGLGAHSKTLLAKFEKDRK